MMYSLHERDAEKRGEERGRVKGYAEGMAQGCAEGRERKAREIAQKLRAMEFDVDKIALAVGYPVDTVKRWLNSSNGSSVTM